MAAGICQGCRRLPLGWLGQDWFPIAADGRSKKGKRMLRREQIDLVRDAVDLKHEIIDV